MKNIYLLLILSCVTLKSVAQVVIDPKGTKVVLDSSKWKISGNNIYNKNAGNVGIGVSNPTAQLHTTGTVRLQGLGTNTINTDIATIDVNGNVTTRTLSSLLNGNAITSLNGLTNSTQTFATGTLGTDFNIASSGSTHTFNFPTASATNRGLLSTANWSTFNNKIGAVTATTAAAVSTVGTTATINNTLAYWNANQLQGRNITSTAPTTGQVLTYNVTTSSWEPAAAAPVTTTNTLTNTANTITSTVNGVAATAPAVNTVVNSSAANNLSTTVNGVAGTTVPIINSISNTSSANSLTTTVNGVAGTGVNIINTNALTQNGINQLISTVNGVAATALTANVTGDVTGNLGAAVVSKINGSPLGTTTGASSGQTLSWNGTAWAPANAAPATTTHTLTNTVNTINSIVNGISATAPAVNTVANNSSTNTLTTTVNGIAGTGVNIINTNALTQNGTNQLVSTVNGVAATALTANVTGDVTGNLGAAVVSKINGSPLGTTTGATSGQTLSWNGTAWAPANAAPSVTTNTLGLSGNTLTSTVNGVAATSNAVGSISNTSSANSLSTTINGVAGTGVNIINSNALTQNGTNQLISTVNGVAATALTANVTGDVTGNLGAAVVSKINGSPLGTTTGASSGQTLSWNGTAWVPANAAPATTTHTLTNTVNTINSTVNGISATAPAVNTVANNSATNTLTTTVNGLSGTGVNIINSNSLNLSSGALTSVVNGVSSGTANVLATANNGLTATSGNVQLGGALTQPTTITTSASNTLTIAGLQSGATTDSLLTVDGAGVIKRRSAPTITSSGPWFNQATGTPATANTQNIYQLGNVGIRNSSPDEALDVAGKIKLSSGKPQDTIYSNNSSGLVLQSLGNTFGTVQLTIQNINGSNGAVFESVGAGNPQLVDFSFKTTNGGQRNLRFETRVNDAFANGGTPEFQFGIAANPTLVVSDAVTFVRKGNLGVGINNPSQALDVNGFITTRLGLMGNSLVPTIGAGTGAGTAPTASVAGNNVGGRVTVTTGIVPVGANAIIATITYSGGATFPIGSSVVLYPANAITATLSGGSMVFAAGTQTTFTIRSGTVALTAATQYSWNYHVIGY